MKTALVSAVMAVVFSFVGNAAGDWVTSGNNMYSGVSGNVGIGTSTPATKLDVAGDVGVLSGALRFDNTWNYNPSYRGITYTTRATLQVPSPGNNSVSIHSPGTLSTALVADGPIISLSGALFSDNVGIGTAAPAARLQVETSDVEGNAVYGNATGKSGIAVYGVADYNAPWFAGTKQNYGGYFVANGPRNIMTMTPTGIGIYAKGGMWAGDFEGAVRIKGNVSLVSKQTGSLIMTLGEGLDYAEGFEVTNKEEAGPGTVLVIDAKNAGKLTVSTAAYDTKVAGIIAGAKGLGSGVRLGSGQFDQNVALAGRVYCNVEATETTVQPGDLLTTSTMPGYAMKVSDYRRAQGAVLGKAMESLEQGKKGQILVLVTLQ